MFPRWAGFGPSGIVRLPSGLFLCFFQSVCRIAPDRPRSGGMHRRHGLRIAIPGVRRGSGTLVRRRPAGIPYGHPAAFSMMGLPAGGGCRQVGGLEWGVPQVGAVQGRRVSVRASGLVFRASGLVFGASGLVFHRLGLVVRPIRWIPGAGGFRRGSRRLRREGSIIMQKKFFLLYIWETKCMYSPQLEIHCVLGMIDHDL